MQRLRILRPNKVDNNPLFLVRLLWFIYYSLLYSTLLIHLQCGMSCLRHPVACPLASPPEVM